MMMKRTFLIASLAVGTWMTIHSLGAQTTTTFGKAPMATINYALSLPGGADGNLSNVAIPPLNVANLPVTVEMWYKPEPTQNYYATLWFTRGTSNAGFQFDRWTGSPVGYTNLKGVWNGAAQIPSTQPMAGQWNHVAMVVTSTSKKIYINGTEFTETGNSFTMFPFDGITYLGWDKASVNPEDRTFKRIN
jgi:hypothetical protein